MGLGLLCLILVFVFDSTPMHQRFWSNYLHNAVYFTGIAFMSGFMLAASITAWAGWYTVFKRVWEAYSLFLIVGLVLMAVVAVGIFGHFHHLYHWADAEALVNDEILKGKSGFLNKWWYTLGSLGFVVVWYLFMNWMRKVSLREDEQGADFDYSFHKKLRLAAAVFLPVAGFTACAVVWLWVMSVDSHWYSTLFAWYTMVSWFLGAISLTILTVIFLKSRGYLSNVSNEHLHDLGKFMFAFSIFWTYLWFSQYMLIWYANVGEETIYFKQRITDYPVLFYGNLIINFLVPFFVLMRNDNKRKIGTLMLTSILIFFGHWWDFFQMIKPGTLLTVQEVMEHAGNSAHDTTAHASHFVMGFTIPGLLEIGTMLGFLALFFFFVFSKMSQAPLQPQNDPYLEESVYHHV
jgi:hypothetical protein